jgi:hypothetical protein
MRPLFYGAEMASIFYIARFKRRFPLPMLTLERIQVLFSELEQASATDHQVRKCILSALEDTCRQHCQNPKSKDVEYVIDRLNEMMEEASDPDEPLPKKKSLATSFITWAASLETDEVCLVASGFDYERAKHLYNEVDRDDVIQMAQQFLKFEMEKVKVGYESVVYGFGGSYEGDSGSSSGGGKSYDLTKDSGRGLAALKELL